MFHVAVFLPQLLVSFVIQKLTFSLPLLIVLLYQHLVPNANQLILNEQVTTNTWVESLTSFNFRKYSAFLLTGTPEELGDESSFCEVCCATLGIDCDLKFVISDKGDPNKNLSSFPVELAPNAAGVGSCSFKASSAGSGSSVL
jgi:hypothetical protein